MARSSVRHMVVPAAVVLAALADAYPRSAQQTPLARPSEHADVPAPPTAEATALLGGLGRGDRLGGWQVEGVFGPRRRGIEVDISRAGTSLALVVARKGAFPMPPPRATSLYVLYYEGHGPSEATLDRGQLDEAIGALAERIEANEAHVPEPAGL